MSNDSRRYIEAWFAKQSDDGEFVLGMRAFPYSVIGPSSGAGPIIFTTKPTYVSAAIGNLERPDEFGMIGRYGLPSEADLRWIRKVIGSRALLFLGDMDPVDLMIFAWLRDSLPPKQVKYLGISDAFLKAFELSPAGPPSIRCVLSEQKSLSLLRKVFPDLCERIGKECTQMLESGHKIELDAIMSDTDKAAEILRSLSLGNGADLGN